MSPAFRTLLLSMTLVGSSIGFGCAKERAAPSASDMDRTRVEFGGLAAEFIPAIDRMTFFGVGSGNLLHTTGLDRPLPDDGSYRFFGGCYTWIAPQKPAAGVARGWVDAQGGPRDWPPDPAMDVGPVRRVAYDARSFTVLGPETRSNLQESKAFVLLAPDLAELRYTIRNRGAESAVAGCWINTAASLEDRIAVRLPAGSEIVGWDATNVERFRSILAAPDARGWALAELPKAAWDGGIKVYIHPATDAPSRVEIAVWRAGAKTWLHRSMGLISPADAARLRAAGEGPVAIYIQPNAGKDPIIEAELYGPIADIAPASDTTAIERWRVIPSASPDRSVLP